jgi:hypothetical protein
MTFEQAQEELKVYLQSLELYGPPPNVYLSNRLLKPDELLCSTIPIISTPYEEGSWIGFIDLYPFHGWPHGCIYVVIDSNGEVSGEDAEFYPDDWSQNFVPIFNIRSSNS